MGKNIWKMYYKSLKSRSALSAPAEIKNAESSLFIDIQVARASLR